MSSASPESRLPSPIPVADERWPLAAIGLDDHLRAGSAAFELQKVHLARDSLSHFSVQLQWRTIPEGAEKVSENALAVLTVMVLAVAIVATIPDRARASVDLPVSLHREI